MSVVMITNDLMFSSRVSVAAKQQELPFKSVSDLSAAISHPELQLLLIDLETRGLKLDELAASVRSLEVQPHTVAFAKHGRVDLLKQARELELDEVLTRGQFDQRVPDILLKINESST